MQSVTDQHAALECGSERHSAAAYTKLSSIPDRNVTIVVKFLALLVRTWEVPC